MFIPNYPVIKIALFFVIGILFSHYLLLPFFYYFSATTILIVISWFFYLKKNKAAYSSFFSGSILLVFFFLGCITKELHNNKNNADNYSHFLVTKKQNVNTKLVFIEELKHSKKHQRFYAHFVSIDSLRVSGKILVHIKDSLFSSNVNLGQTYTLKGNYTPNKKLNNPNLFDYSNYLENKNIYGQFYTNLDDVILDLNSKKSIVFYANYIRNRITNSMKQFGFTPNQIGIFSALLLGQKQDIDTAVIEDYQYAGAIHILSVSGLHVGIILGILMLLLKPFANTPKARLVKMLITVAFLWLFGILAGLSPSILRSVTMFSFIALARYLNQESNVYNTLALSIFCLLLVQPNFIFDVGFQLSYAAVFGIVFIVPFFYKMYNPANWLVQQLYTIFAVSCAAQLATLPICLYYFHQTTALFFITNLIILPFLGFLLGLGLLVAVLAFFHINILYFTRALQFLLDGLNYIVHSIASFKTFVFTDISISLAYVFLFYLAGTSLISYLKKPNFCSLISTVFLAFCLQLAYLVSDFNCNQTNQFILFSKYKDSEIAIRKGKIIAYYFSKNIDVSSNKNRLITNYAIANNCVIKSSVPMPNLFYFKNKKILVVDEKAVWPINLQADIVLLCNSPKINLVRILQQVQPKLIVCDGSNYKSYIDLWQKTCAQKNIPFHNTYEKGYFSF